MITGHKRKRVKDEEMDHPDEKRRRLSRNDSVQLLPVDEEIEGDDNVIVPPPDVPDDTTLCMICMDRKWNTSLDCCSRRYCVECANGIVAVDTPTCAYCRKLIYQIHISDDEGFRTVDGTARPTSEEPAHPRGVINVAGFCITSKNGITRVTHGGETIHKKTLNTFIFFLKKNINCIYNF